MKKSFLQTLRSLNERLSVWAICRFNVPLPDLQQTDQPVPGRIYYYYGRWFKLVKHTPEHMQQIKEVTSSPDLFLLNTDLDVDTISGSFAGINCDFAIQKKAKLENLLSDVVCAGCKLKQLGLPCKKVYQFNDRTKDLCFTHYYKLIKGKKND